MTMESPTLVIGIGDLLRLQVGMCSFPMTMDIR